MKCLAIVAILIGFTGSAFAQLSDETLYTPLENQINSTHEFDTQFELNYNQSVVIPTSNISIRFMEVLEDSRCPSDVACIWEGRSTLSLGVADEQNKEINLSIDSHDSVTVFNKYKIHLIDVKPYPISTKIITSEDYVAVLKITKDNVTYVENTALELLSPLKQFKSGIPSNEITCRPGLELVIKSIDSSPACVKPTTSGQLLFRGWAAEDNSIQPIIKTGTDAWHCLGYCFEDYTITSEEIVYMQSGRESASGEWLDLPAKTKEIPMSKEAWNNLVNLADFQKFNSLPDKVGCPGCADAPVEWIEISYGDKTKKIEFERGDQIPEINQLILALQELTDSIDSEIGSFEECVDAGNPVMESYPRQCRTADGKNFVEEINSKLMSPESLCKKYGGNWLEEFNECETISSEQCSDMNGTFKECESACRHDPNAQVCTMQCVQVCTIP